MIPTYIVELVSKYNGSYPELNEAVRQGKEVCETCGDKLMMWERPWCPRCEKPEPTTLQSLDFFKCVYHIEAMEGIDYNRGSRSDFHEALWMGIIDDVRNDTYMTGGLLSLDELEERWDPSGTFVPAIKLFNKYFPIGNDTIIWISW